jgi:hypothetical protein
LSVTRALVTRTLDLARTMKRIIRKGLMIVLGYLVLYVAVWVTASAGLLKDVEFGYYGEFNVAKHAIQKTGCAQKIEYGGVNRDVVLEEMHFRVRTLAGRIVKLWFDASNMDVTQVCNRPAGLIVWHDAYEEGQKYSIARVSELLREKRIQVKDLRDVLCNIDELEEIFRLNPGDMNDALASDTYAWDCLRIEFLSKDYKYADRKDIYGWGYTDITEKDVADWP